MARKHPNYEEVHFHSAEKLWDALSPAQSPFPEPYKLIFRGQPDSKLGLIPSVLRFEGKPPSVDASMMVFHEIRNLEIFVEHCDMVGIPIPNDSQRYRSQVVNTQTADRFYKDPSRWPNDEILDLMAMAQHHGVPTRMLDWTTKAYAAAYFAASTSLAGFNDWKDETKLAIWVMNIEMLGLHPNIKLHYSPGAASPHLAAQGGLFTVHPHNGLRSGEFNVQGLEELFADISLPALFKYTLPAYESGALLNLCKRAGFSAAHVYPSADGAGKAVIDSIKHQAAIEKFNVNAILVR